ncbi:GATA transcription factor 18-like [Prosopis cineraria]|uniref:GATA transcription factor 18-like n=1 Tax=Prosopis cineraria TaxID=364024 RepID=UPI00240F6C88|nr:GATA transcription factor 18-like [Prosopis cineraria]
MMHRCCGSQGHVIGPCTCGMIHGQNNSFSVLFSMPNHNHKSYGDCDMYSFTPSPSSSVDCTLSLGTPSTRLSVDEEKRNRHDHRSVSNFCWDLLQSKHTSHSHTKSGRGANSSNSSGDPLLARRCANCDTTSTPLWRNGPRGPKSLCNACGIRFKKEERRASAVAATTAANSGSVMESAPMYTGQHNTSWYAHSQSQKMQCISPGMGNEFRVSDDADRGIPFLSWRLNVSDRPSLVHDFTR